jgi:hypothetical protein
MRRIAIVVALSVFGTAAAAMPVGSIRADDGTLVMVGKRGGSSRSAISGRFVTRSHANRNPRTTVTHGKY